MLSLSKRGKRMQGVSFVTLYFLSTNLLRGQYYSQESTSLSSPCWGLTWNHFLYTKIPPIFHKYTPFTEGELISQKLTCRGQKMMVKLEDCAAFVLAWAHTRGSMNVLQLIFGMTMANWYEYLNFGCHILVHILRIDNFARIAIPTEENIESYLSAKSSQHLTIGNRRVWCSMEGLKLYFKEAPNFYFIMAGLMTVMVYLCLSLLQMEQFQFHFSISLDVFMTV